MILPLVKNGTGSFRDIASAYDPEEIVSVLVKTFQTDSIDQIIDEVRR